MHTDISFCSWKFLFVFGTWSPSLQISVLSVKIPENPDMLRITISNLGSLRSIILFFLGLWLGYAFASVILSALWMVIAMSCMHHVLNWILWICICSQRSHFYQFSLQWRDLDDIAWDLLHLALWFYLLWNQSALFLSQSGASWKFLTLPQKTGLGR